jgi:hypothetical protein
MFVWLTIGFAVIHNVISFWSLSLLDFIANRDVRHEHLQLTEEGEPVIQSWGIGRGWTSRQLDGTRLPDSTGIKIANGFRVAAPEGHTPYSWNRRVDSFSDYLSPSTNWFLVAPTIRSSTAYFVGYEARSRRLVGYLGINGFSTAQPTKEQSFVITTSFYNAFAGNLASTIAPGNLPEPIEWGEDAAPPNTAQYANATPDEAWILSQGTIYGIQLRSRKVRVLLKDRPDALWLRQASVSRDGRSFLSLVARTETGLLFIDPSTGEQETTSISLLPYDSFYQLTSGKRLLLQMPQASRQGFGRQFVISWFNEAGEVERRQDVELPPSTESKILSFPTMVAASQPSPMTAFVAWVFGPFFSYHEPDATRNYFGELWHALIEFKLWCLVSLLAGGIAGWACRNRERDVFGNKHWFWPIVVGLCGWFGWMGYICVRPLPARLSNRQWMPIQPEPVRPIGTEIFA